MQQFFGGYFHQDWDLEADDWEGVVDNYVDDIPDVGRLRALAGEIAALCEKYAEPELEQLMNRTILLDFRPWPLTHHEWLGEVAARLHRHADGIAAARRTVTQDRRP